MKTCLLALFVAFFVVFAQASPSLRGHDGEVMEETVGGGRSLEEEEESGYNWTAWKETFDEYESMAEEVHATRDFVD